MPPNDPPFVPPPQDLPEGTPTLASVDARFDVLPSIPLPSSLATMDPSATGYLAWGQTLHRFRDGGLRAQPSAAALNGALVSFTRVHSGLAWLVVDGLGIRVVLEPEVPSPADFGDNWVFVADYLIAFSPAKLPDGDLVLATAWRFVFVAQTMPSATDLLGRGSTPLDTRPAASFITIDPTQFNAQLLGPAPYTSSALPIGRVGY